MEKMMRKITLLVVFLIVSVSFVPMIIVPVGAPETPSQVPVFETPSGNLIQINYATPAKKQISLARFSNSKGLDAVIGNVSSSKFEPHLKLNRWDGECSLSVWLPTDGLPSQSNVPDFVSGILEQRVSDNAKVRFYPLPPTEYTEGEHTFIQNEEGGVEFEVILDSVPASNVITFNIETQGLKFYYQPPLTDELNPADYDFINETHAIKDGVVVIHRPENVVGSYAVYHATRTNMHRTKEDAEKYKTGKAFHIYRPKIIDAIGNEIWGDLNIDEQNGTLTITIDQTWLDNGVYPVNVDPTFGYETVGGSDYLNSGDEMDGSLFTSPADAGSADSISMYVKAATGPPRYLKGVIVLHSNMNILTNGVGVEVKGNTTASWHTSDFSTSPDLSGNTEYVLMGVFSGGFLFYYDTGETDQGHIDETNNYDSPEDPTDATHNNYKFSIYCTYTVEAPAVSISVTPTSYDFGFLDLNSVSSTGTAGYFNITNEGTGDINLTIKSSNATDGTNIWVLAETNGPDQYTLQQPCLNRPWRLT